MRILESKKGIEMVDQWVELLMFTLLIISFALSVSIGSLVFNYIVVFIFGLMSGRFLYYRRKTFPFYLIVFGGIVGYLIGVRYGSWKMTLFLFIVGTTISWYLHSKRIIR